MEKYIILIYFYFRLENSNGYSSIRVGFRHKYNNIITFRFCLQRLFRVLSRWYTAKLGSNQSTYKLLFFFDKFEFNLLKSKKIYRMLENNSFDDWINSFN